MDRKEKKQWFVYVLLCVDKSLYTGISVDPLARFREHRRGKGGRYTRAHKPHRIVYTEVCESHSHALKREAEIKRWKRNVKVRNLGLVFQEELQK